MSDGSPDTILRQALAAFRQANNLTADENCAETWTCRIWFATVRLPNFQWRREAILAHDLHHVLVGYPCTLWGEMRMAAWEFGAGRMPHWGARLFCVPLLSIGLLRSPRQMLTAFLTGQRSRSLHTAERAEALLDLSLVAARAMITSCRSPVVGRDSYGRFALLLLESLVVLLLPVAALGGIAVAVLSLFSA